jgi:hypothetical protein
MFRNKFQVRTDQLDHKRYRVAAAQLSKKIVAISSGTSSISQFISQLVITSQLSEFHLSTSNYNYQSVVKTASE